MKDNYKDPITYTYENAVVRIYFPDITEEEKTARLKRVYAAAANLLLDMRGSERNAT